jgi:3-hydroxyacyl-[acyl-carrier-protein] dehydratase
MIRSEIKNSMTEYNSANKNEISAKFAFPSSFTGFSGHFPSNPVLPGVCQIQCILVALSEKYGRELKLKSISRGKFLNPVFPDEEITLEGTSNIEDGIISGKFRITKASRGKEVNVSRISLVCK